ncbi:unnamed protein product [Cylindrotheca closterium]|uniref:Uncharacterized protein n=1 Tax=Cylindrotheca closterium TaxID=2856 RepID=A0AAD2FT47_9STRA|nr:unnamed protein product [Cylindrotheca closterium]
MSGTTSTTFQLQPPIMGYTMEINSSGDKMAVVGTGKPFRTGAHWIPVHHWHFLQTSNVPSMEMGNTVIYIPKVCLSSLSEKAISKSSSSVAKQVEHQDKCYDKYDKANDTEAKIFLCNSLDPELAAKLYLKVKTVNPFPVMFQKFIQMLHITSIHYFKGLKTNICKHKPSQYSGEDIAQMAEDNKEDANELTIAGQYKFNLNNVMVGNFLEASRAEHNSYRHEMLNVSAKMDKVLIEIGYMDKEAAAKHLEAEELTTSTSVTRPRTLTVYSLTSINGPLKDPPSKIPRLRMPRWPRHSPPMTHTNDATKRDLKGSGPQANQLRFTRAWYTPFRNDQPCLLSLRVVWTIIQHFLSYLPQLVVAFFLARSIGVTTPNVSTFMADHVSTASSFFLTASSFLTGQVSCMMSQASIASAYLFTAASTVIAAFEGSPTNRLAPLLWFTLLILVSLPTMSHWVPASRVLPVPDDQSKV